MRNRNDLTQERVRELFNYDPETGILKYLVGRGQAKAGMIAGTVNGKGYKQVMIDGFIYVVSHVVWLYVHGYLPKEIDHKFGNQADDRIVKLREANRHQNVCNRGMQKNNKSGFKGVSRDKTISEDGKCWRARIKVMGKETIIGYFHTKEEAYNAYCEAANELHGEFVRKAG